MTDGSIIVSQFTGADLIANKDFGLTGNVGGCLSISYMSVNYIFAFVRVLLLYRIVMRCT